MSCDADPAFVPSEADMKRISWALAYPFDRPDSSFIFVNGKTFKFDAHDWRGTGKALETLTVTSTDGSQLTAR